MNSLFRLTLSLLICLCQFRNTYGQPAYPKNYFRNPLTIPILLAGNFGECRPGHFHSGIDIKTGGHENEPVYAVADGYISRIKMEPGGFGHGLYITHPNGYTTLYAHLNYFITSVQKYVRTQQYAKQSWTVDLSFSPDQFPVKKGDQIAWSGNTGSSSAPHLHFEIRDTKTEHPLNPQLFGFDIKDTKPPVPVKLALYNTEHSIYEQAPELFTLFKRKDGYAPKPDTIEFVKGKTGVGIVVDDYMEGSDNTLAFYTVRWYLDDVLQGGIVLDDIGYDETRYLHAYADYKTKQNGGPWVQCLFRIPGNALGRIYTGLNNNSGALAINDEQPHLVKIELKDAYGNESDIRFVLRQSRSDNIQGCDKSSVFSPGKMNYYDLPACRFYLDEKQLYDDVCFTISDKPSPDALSTLWSLSRPSVPLHHYFDLYLKPNMPIGFSLRGKVAMLFNEGKETSGKVALVAEKGWYKASVRSLGTYWLAADTVAPVITPIGSIKGNLSTIKRLTFKADDTMTSVKSFRGELDGHWILFEQHDKQWFYEIDNHCGKGNHTLVVKAVDENGNETIKQYSFTR